jgi:hypothetical protein
MSRACLILSKHTSCRHHIAWVIDSGASKHVTGMSNSFKTYSPYTHSESIQIADGTSQLIHGVGSVECHTFS